MGRRHKALVAGLATSTVAGHLLYPTALALTWRRRAPRPPAPVVWPPLTVVIPAYLESGVIATKIEDVRANGYPGLLEILVVADADPATAAVAEATGARVLLLPRRGGKSQALNAGVEASTHDVIVLTDANNTMTPGSLCALVRWFSLPHVGAVAGEKVEGDGGELLYWHFEAWLKQREAALGTTLGLDGGLCAVRRSAWRRIPPDISNDDLWIALDMMERGHTVAYERGAVVRESSVGALRLSWERRTRVLGGSLWVFWRKRHLLVRPGLLQFEIVGHKLWRSSVGPLSHVALLVLSAAASRRSALARLFLAVHGLSAAGVLAQERSLRVPRLLSVGGQVLYLQLVALGGLSRFLRGDRVLLWSKPPR